MLARQSLGRCTACHSRLLSNSAISMRPAPGGARDEAAPSSSSKQVEQGGHTLPPSRLSRPLGIDTPPNVKRTDELQWRTRMADTKTKIDERRHLVKEASKGYFNDYNKLRHEGGKSFVAPHTLIKKELAKYFPNIHGMALSDKAARTTADILPGKVSLVVISSFQSSDEHVKSFADSVVPHFQDDPLFQYVYLNIQENKLKSWILKMFLTSLRHRIPTRFQPTYIVSHDSLEFVRDPLGLENKHVGYVYLVDTHAKVRWAGCAYASTAEIEDLRRCTTVLLDRSRSAAGAAAAGGSGDTRSA